MADAPDPVSSSPDMIPGGYDAASDADLGPWVKVSASPPGGQEAQWRADFAADTPPWQQT